MTIMENEKYMVLYLGVKDGEVAGVYEADTLGKIGSEVQALDQDKLREELPHLAAVKQIKSHTTFCAQSSPICIYFQCGGVWYKICLK